MCSGPRPFNLAKYQVCCQSLLGWASSALHWMKSLVESGRVVMVTFSSTRKADHWLVVMLVMLMEVSSFAFLIVVKKSGG